MENEPRVAMTGKTPSRNATSITDEESQQNRETSGSGRGIAQGDEQSSPRTDGGETGPDREQGSANEYFRSRAGRICKTVYQAGLKQLPSWFKAVFCGEF